MCTQNKHACLHDQVQIQKYLSVISGWSPMVRGMGKGWRLEIERKSVSSEWEVAWINHEEVPWTQARDKLTLHSWASFVPSSFMKLCVWVPIHVCIYTLSISSISNLYHLSVSCLYPQIFMSIYLVTLNHKSILRDLQNIEKMSTQRYLLQHSF